MKRHNRKMIAAAVMGWIGIVNAYAGQATTSASATNGLGHPGHANATANYEGLGGQGFARTRTDTNGGLSIGRGLAVGFDEQGLDVSFSHALAPQFGPAYAGTFNMSIGANGQVSSSYGGTLAEGGLVRTAEAGGTTQSGWNGANASAHATGHTAPGGRVNSWTGSNSSPAPYGVVRQVPVRPGQGHAVAPAVYGRPAGYGAGSHGVRPVSIQRSNVYGLRR